MKGISIIYCFVILAEATMTQRIIAFIAFIAVAAIAFFIIRWRSNRSLRKVLRGWRFSWGPSYEPEGSPLEEKKVVTIYDFYEDPLDKHRFISPVDPRLTVREATYKNHDLMTFATSWPHLFTDQQLAEIQKIILEITKLAGSSHKIVVTKSPAANFSDFKSKLIGEIFAQLHRQYAMRLFRQHFRIEKDRDRVIDLNFDNGYDYLDEFCDLLNTRQSILHVIVHDNIRERKIVLIKDDDRSWLELKNDVLAVAADYFPAGVDWEGEWSNEPVIPNEVVVFFSCNGKCELVLSFLDILLEKRIEQIVKDSSLGVVSAHLHYSFSPRKSTLTIVFVSVVNYYEVLQLLGLFQEKYDSNINLKLVSNEQSKGLQWRDEYPFTVHINGLEELIIFMPFDINSDLLQTELLKIGAILKAHVDYNIHDTRKIRFTLKKHKEVNWSELKTDILAAIIIGCPGFELSLCSWPKDEIAINSDTLGQGSLNT
jgi:hypothetical protein